MITGSGLRWEMFLLPVMLTHSETARFLLQLRSKSRVSSRSSTGSHPPPASMD